MYALAFLILSVTQAVIWGQTITPVYVQSNNPVTLTCPADDQARTLTWTGPGGNLYVTGTTVEVHLGYDINGDPRVSASHTGGSYTLRFTEFQSSDTGIYTCTVDGTVSIQMVIVQGVTSASPVNTRQGGTVKLQCPDAGGSVAWSVTSITVIYTQGTQINPNIPDDTRTRLSVIAQGGNYNLQISDVQLSDIREYKCASGVIDTFYHLLLYIPPSLPEIENTVIVNGQNRTTGTEDSSMTLTCNSRGGTPAASVSWIKDGTTLVTSDNTVQYTKVFTRADDRTVYTCQSDSPALTSPQTTTVLVYLDLKPGQPTISNQLSQTENNNLQVVCESTGSRPAAMIQWNVGGTWQSNNPTEVKVKDSVTDTYIVTSNLSLPVTRQDNRKSVYCGASNQALSGGIESVQRSITVLFGPDGVSITGNSVIVSDGTNTLTLTCTTQEYNRHVHITWYNGTTQIPNTAVVTNTSGTYGGYISTQVLQLTPDRYQDGNVIRCVVQNEGVTIGQETASVTLNLNYRPYVTLTPTPGVNVIEGGELEISCDVDSNPPSSLTWTRVGGQLPSNSDVTSGVLRIPSTHREVRGTYTCTAQNSVGREDESLSIDIYYPPDIRVTYTNTTFTSPNRTFTCVPDGNPDSYKFGQWRHTAEDGTEIRQLTGSSSTTKSVLVLPDPGVTRRYEDTGYYICEASNNIPSSTFYRSGSGFFVVESPPVANIPTNTAIINGQIGKSVRIAVEFYSRLAVSSSDVTWTRKSKDLLPCDTFVTSLVSRAINMPFHGVDVQVEGYIAVLNINELATEDLGDYTVTIENRMGKERYTVKIINRGPPKQPLHLLQKQVTSSSITVQWSPVRDEGQSQTFVIGYKSDVSIPYTDLDAIPDSRESVMSYTIEGLAPDTFYHIRIYAQNEFGRSHKLYLNCSTIYLHCPTTTDEDKLVSTRTALISVSSIFVVFIITTVVIFIVFRMRQGSGERTNKKTNPETDTNQRFVPHHSFFHDSKQHSTYQDLNLENITPPSVYEDIQERDRRPAGDTNQQNAYEVLGRQAAPNVYEQLSK